MDVQDSRMATVGASLRDEDDGARTRGDCCCHRPADAEPEKGGEGRERRDRLGEQSDGDDDVSDDASIPESWPMSGLLCVADEVPGFEGVLLSGCRDDEWMLDLN